MFSAARLAFFVHKEDGGGPTTGARIEKGPEKQKIKEKDNLPQSEKERRLNEGGRGVEYHDDPKKVFDAMAAKVFKPGEYKDSVRRDYALKLERAMREGVKNNTVYGDEFDKFWKDLAFDNEEIRKKDPTIYPKNKCARISVLNDHFLFIDKNGTEMKEDGLDKMNARVEGVPINVDEEPSVGVRKVTQEARDAEARERARMAKISEGKAIRKQFIVGGDMSGTVKFENSEDWKNTTVYALYPDAEEGDTLYHKNLGGTKRTAIFSNGEWRYEDEKGEWDKVKINNGDTLAYVPATKAQEKRFNKSAEGKEYMSHGYFRMPTDRDVTWEKIAEAFFHSGKTPQGETFQEKTVDDSNPEAHSPQAVLKKLGYSSEKPEDVKKIAQILRDAKINQEDPIFVTFVVPEANPRIDREQLKAADDAARKQAVEREYAKNIDTWQDINAVMGKHFNNLTKNEDYELSNKIVEIVNDEDLWKAYWDNGFKGKEKIERAFQFWGFKGNAREKLRDAITGTGLGALFNSNKKVNFEDLLTYFPVYKNLDGKDSHDVEEFNNEMSFQQIAWNRHINMMNGRAEFSGINEEQQKFYRKMAKKYAGRPDLLEGSEYFKYTNILYGAGCLMEGLQTLDIRTSVEETRARLERKTEAKERREKAGVLRDNGERFAKNAEEAFLFKLLSPAESMSFGDMEKTGAKTTEGAVVVQVLFNASQGGKIDRAKMINELKAYVRGGLGAYLTAEPREKGVLREKFGLPENAYEDMKSLEQFANFKDFAYPRGEDPKSMEYTRNLILKGFEMKRGDGGKVETAAEVKPWKTLAELRNDPEYKDVIAKQEELERRLEIANGAENQIVAGTLREWLRAHPEHQISETELKAKVKEMDDLVKENSIIDFDAAVDVDTTQPAGQELQAVRLGIAKRSIDLGAGFKFIVGGTINVVTGQPAVVAGITFGGNISENVKGYLGATAGVEPFTARVFAGFDGGLTFIIPGDVPKKIDEKDTSEKWNTEIGVGAGVGVSASLNISDLLRLGPYVRADVTRRRDFEGEYKQKLAVEMGAAGYDVIDQIKTPEAKAAAIRSLRFPPQNKAYFMEIQGNDPSIDDAKLIQMFERSKEGLKLIALRKVQETASGLTVLGIGGGIDARLILAMLFPPIAPFLYVQAGVAAGSRITFGYERTRSDQEMISAADQEFLDKLQAAYPDIEIEVKAQTFETTEAIISNDFSGLQGLQRLHRTEQSPQSISKMEINVPKGLEFSELQERFAENHLKLDIEEIEPGIKMYTLQPTEVTFGSYHIAADPAMSLDHGVIVKNGKIFIAASRDLSELHIRRYDAFYPGDVDGTPQHALITLSDNPHQKPDTILEASDFIVESRFDKEKMVPGPLEIVENPARFNRRSRVRTNLDTYENFKGRGVFDKFTNAEKLGLSQVAEVQNDTIRFKTDLGLTEMALKEQAQFTEGSNIDNVIPTPEEFIEDPKNAIFYREITTKPTTRVIKELDMLIDAQCRSNGQPLTIEQKILFAESVFHHSMAECIKEGLITEKQAIDNRIKLAETIYKPFFEEGLAKLNPQPSPDITADALLHAYIAGIRNHIADLPSPLFAGDSIDVMVGTKGFLGRRSINNASGKTHEMIFRQAVDYNQYLNSTDPRHEEQRTIARILFSNHSEMPAEGQDKEFLESRMAKKLMFLGDSERINPLIHMLDGNEAQSRIHFATLIAAYKAINQGQSLDRTEYKAAIQALRNVAETVRNAQLGEGTPVLIDGKEMRAVYINGYYVMIQTTLKSGIYDWCKNPSTVYNESLMIVKAKPGAKVLRPGTVISSAQDTALAYRAGLEVDTIGINAIGTVVIQTAPEWSYTSRGGGGGEGEKPPFKLIIKPNPGVGQESGGGRVTNPRDNSISTGGSGGGGEAG